MQKTLRLVTAYVVLFSNALGQDVSEIGIVRPSLRCTLIKDGQDLRRDNGQNTERAARNFLERSTRLESKQDQILAGMDLAYDSVEAIVSSEPTGALALWVKREGKDAARKMEKVFEAERTRLQADFIHDVTSGGGRDILGRKILGDALLEAASTSDSPFVSLIIAEEVAQNKLLERALILAAENSAGVEDLDERVGKIKATMEQFQGDQLERFDQLKKNIASTNQRISKMGVELRGRIDRGQIKTAAQFNNVNRDLEFLKRITFGKLTPPEKLKAIEARVKTVDEEQKQRIELESKVWETRKNVNEFLADTRQLTVLAQNLQLVDDEVAADILDKVDRTSKAFEAGAAIALATTPMGYVAAVNLAFSAFGPGRRGSARAHREMMKALRGVRDEVRTSKQEVLSAVSQGRAAVENRLQSVAAQLNSLELNQDQMMNMQEDLALMVNAVTNDIAELSNKVEDLNRGLSTATDRLERAHSFSRQDNINSEWLKGEPLALFVEATRKKFSGATPGSLSASAKFMQIEHNRDNFTSGEDWLSEKLSTREDLNSRRISPILYYRNVEHIDLFTVDFKLDDYIHLTAHPMMVFADHLRMKDSANFERSLAAMLTPARDLFHIGQQDKPFPSEFDFRRDCKALLSSESICELGSLAADFVIWYELIGNYDTGRVFSQKEFGAQGNQRGFDLISEMRRIANIAIVQYALLDGDAVMEQMEFVLLDQYDDAVRLDLERRIARLHAQESVEREARTRAGARRQRFKDKAGAFGTKPLVERLAALKADIQSLRESFVNERVLNLQKIDLPEPHTANSVALAEGNQAIGLDIVPELTALGEPSSLDDPGLAGVVPKKTVSESEHTTLLSLKSDRYRTIRNDTAMRKSAADQRMKISDHYGRQEEKSKDTESQYRARREKLEAQLSAMPVKKTSGKFSPESLTLLCEALRNNPKLRNNFSTYVVSRALKRRGRSVLQYRLACTQVPSTVMDQFGLDTAAFSVAKLDGPQGGFEGWVLRLPKPPKGDIIELPLPSPEAVLSGELVRSTELSNLLRLRDRLDLEIANIVATQ